MAKKILIIDDEPDIIKIFSLRLKAKNFDAVGANNGTEGIESVKSGDVCLIFLDYFLPDLNGYEVFQKIRETAQGQNIPVVFISANEEKLNEIPTAENTEKQVKPVSGEKIVELASKYCSQ